MKLAALVPLLLLASCASAPKKKLHRTHLRNLDMTVCVLNDGGDLLRCPCRDFVVSLDAAGRSKLKCLQPETATAP